MENKYLDKIADAFNIPAPDATTMDDYLDAILPDVGQWGEDLAEDEFYLDKAWLEIRDDIDFHEAVLHFFQADGEYLRSVNGDISPGSWRFLESSNKFIIEIDGASELYDLAFLDGDFFILDKHGDQQKLGNAKYFVMMREAIAKRLEWKDAMDYLFARYKSQNNNFIIFSLIVLAVIAIIVIFSFR